MFPVEIEGVFHKKIEESMGECFVFVFKASWFFNHLEYNLAFFMGEEI